MKKTLTTIFGIIIIGLGTGYAQWDKLTDSYSSVDISDVCLINDRIIAVGTQFSNFQGHIFIGKNKGTQWDTLQVPPSGYFFKTIAFKDKDTGFIGGYGSISIWLRTTDGGQTWSYFNQDGANKGISDMVFLNDKIGFAGGYGTEQFFTGNCYHTTDGGNTWIPIEDSLKNQPIDQISFPDAQHGFGVGGIFASKNFMATEDGGITWKNVYNHNTIPGGIYFWNKDEGILVDAAGAAYKTADGGKNWVKKNTHNSTGLNSVAFNGDVGYAVGNYGVILRSNDRGENWTKEKSPTNAILAKVRFYNNIALACGNGGTIIATHDITGMNEKPSLSLKIYPNPANDILNIESTTALPATANIYNTLGQLMAENMPIVNGTIDIKSLKSGAYSLVVTTDRGEIKQLFIKSE